MASNPKDNPTFNLESMPQFTAGVPQKVDLEPASGTAPYKCDISKGNLPDGLTLSTDGIVSGAAKTANDPNPATVFFRVTDSANVEGTRAYEITVVAGTKNTVSA